MERIALLCLSALLAVAPVARAGDDASAVDRTPPGYDPALARRVAADARGMRSYVLVILKTGPGRMPDGDARTAMFAGHMANIGRLADEGKLAMAGPFAQHPDGWRGVLLLAVPDIEEARRLTATDPVIIAGEMVAEYHRWYGSAALMLVPEMHRTLVPPAG